MISLIYVRRAANLTYLEELKNVMLNGKVRLEAEKGYNDAGGR